jgi:hypothetical protein
LADNRQEEEAAATQPGVRTPVVLPRKAPPKMPSKEKPPMPRSKAKGPLHVGQKKRPPGLPSAKRRPKPLGPGGKKQPSIGKEKAAPQL